MSHEALRSATENAMRAYEERDAALATLRAARFVADYWRQAMMAADESRWAAHPLCMVLAALDGETNPVECGIDDSEWSDFRAALSGRRPNDG